MRVALLSSITLLAFANVQAQITFQKAFGGSGFEYGYTMQKTSDGGCIVGGTTSSFGAAGDYFYVVKFDASGTEQWNGIYGSGNGADPVNDIYPTSDGGYIIGGYINSLFPSSSAAYIVKINSIGDTLWTKYWGADTTNGFSDSYLVLEAADGNVLIGGYTTVYGAGEEDAFLIKLNATTGDTIWTRVWGGPLNEWLYGMQLTDDGGIILAGVTSSFGAGGIDILLIKSDADGNIEWARAIGGPGNEFGFGHCVEQTSDRGFILTGVGGFLIKTDSLGVMQWQNAYYVPGGFNGHAVDQTTDGGYILGGTVGSDTERAYVLKTDSLGNEEWSKFYGGMVGERCWALKQANDGGFYMSGQTSSFGTGTDAYLIKMDASGNSNCYQVDTSAVRSNPGYSDTLIQLQVHYGPQTRNTNTKVLTGYSEINLCITTGMAAVKEQPVVSVFPNPASDKITIDCNFTGWNQNDYQLEIINGISQVIQTEKLAENIGPSTLNISTYPNGFYIVLLRSQNQMVGASKFVKE